MASVVLYHTEGCHLCEQAHALLKAHAMVNDIEQRDIICDPSWLAAYQVRIPVITIAMGQQQSAQQPAELGWPFDYQTLTEFLEQYGPN